MSTSLRTSLSITERNACSFYGKQTRNLFSLVALWNSSSLLSGIAHSNRLQSCSAARMKPYQGRIQTACSMTPNAHAPIDACMGKADHGDRQHLLECSPLTDTPIYAKERDADHVALTIEAVHAIILQAPLEPRCAVHRQGLWGLLYRRRPAHILASLHLPWQVLAIAQALPGICLR